jgi:restriction endonuclease S subunit
MKKSIQNLAEIRFGLHLATDRNGTLPYLQVRQFDEQGQLSLAADEYVLDDKKNQAHLLQDGDVLFVGKGNRLFAWCYRSTMGPYVPSSIFFVLRPKTELVQPEYLCAVLNAPQSKSVFQQIGSGTNILSIRKSELGAFEIPIPGLDRQQKIAELTHLHQRSLDLNKSLQNQQELLYQGFMAKLTKD